MSTTKNVATSLAACVGSSEQVLCCARARSAFTFHWHRTRSSDCISLMTHWPRIRRHSSMHTTSSFIYHTYIYSCILLCRLVASCGSRVTMPRMPERGASSIKSNTEESRASWNWGLYSCATTTVSCRRSYFSCLYYNWSCVLDLCQRRTHLEFLRFFLGIKDRRLQLWLTSLRYAPVDLLGFWAFDVFLKKCTMESIIYRLGDSLTMRMSKKAWK